jgi:CRISPR/Cas system-associated protein Csm6
VGCSSTWNGTCRVCEEEKPVTETRDYGYFYTGIRKLQEQLKELS